MATFINVDHEAISLLEQNRRQVDANRISSLEGVEQKRLRDQIQATRQRQRRPVRGRLRPGRREELAATAKPINLIVLELSYDRNDSIGIPDLRIYELMPSQPGVYDLTVRNQTGYGTGWLFTEFREAFANDITPYSRGYPYTNGSFQNQVFWPGDDITNSDLPQLNLSPEKRYDFFVIDLTKNLELIESPFNTSTTFNYEVYVSQRKYIPVEYENVVDKSLVLNVYQVSTRPGNAYTYGQSYNNFPVNLLDLPKFIALGSKNKKTININTEVDFRLVDVANLALPGKKVLNIKIVNSKFNKIEILT
jgi:hypothetical protein